VENEYAFIDLPGLLEIRTERRAMELLENIEIIQFPHLSEKKDREGIIKKLQDRISKEPPPPPKTAEEQYQALKLSMGAG